MRHGVLQIVMLLTLSNYANVSVAEEPSIRKAEIEALIEQLVSPNKPPRRVGPDAEYSEDFDHEAQKQVRAAWDKLYDLGPPTFPYLFQHFADKRYSFTEDNGFVEDNWSVGQACRDIVNSYLEPYNRFPWVIGEGDPRGRTIRPSYIQHFGLDDGKLAEQWWRRHREKSLREIQILILEWALTEEVKRPNVYDIEERRHIESILTKLEVSDKPLEPSRPFSR